MDGQLGPRGSDDLLLLRTRKLTKNGLTDRSRGLDRQRVHEHVRRGGHDGQLKLDARSFCTPDAKQND